MTLSWFYYGIFFDVIVVVLATGQPSKLPLLSSDKQLPLFGIVYSNATDQAKSTFDAQFNAFLSNGANSYQLFTTWDTINTSGISLVDTLFAITTASNLQPIFTLATINTNVLSIPSQFLNGTILQNGLHFNNSTIVNQFTSLLDQVIPILLQNNGFSISIGNEIDVWLSFNVEEQDSYLQFLYLMVEHIHLINSSIAVSATLTIDAFKNYNSSNYAFLPTLFSFIDVAYITWYGVGQAVSDPSTASKDLNLVISLLPVNMFLIIQELGYPSGYNPNSIYINSTELKQHDWLINAVEAIKLNFNVVKFFSILKLNDWTSDECNSYVSYYNNTDPAFAEVLCSLGLSYSNGTKKLSYDGVMESIQDLRGIAPVNNEPISSPVGNIPTSTPSNIPSLASITFNMNYNIMLILFAILQIIKCD